MNTVIGLFDGFEDAREVIRDLEASGFNRHRMSVVAQHDVLEQEQDGGATGAGAVIGAGVGVLAGLAAITIPGIGLVAAIGPILAGGVIGAVAGGLIGSLVDAGVPAEQAAYYTEGVRRGGTLVAIATHDVDAPRAIEVMNRHNPVNLSERVVQWQQDGWVPETTGHSTAEVRPPETESLTR